MKLKDKKDKDLADLSQSKDLWKDLKLSNTDLSNLLSELDKAIEGEKSKGEYGEGKTSNPTPSQTDQVYGQSPSDSVNS